MVTPEQLHMWYLEAVENLSPSDFNPKANKPYSELTDEQKYIDKYIADKINQRFPANMTICPKCGALLVDILTVLHNCPSSNTGHNKDS